MPKKIPGSRLVILNDVIAPGSGITGAANIAFKNKVKERSAWNAALAAASGTELKLIKVDHRIYPLHLIDRVHNHFVLEFNDGSFSTCVGMMLGGNRQDYIGPMYARLRYYYIIPVSESIKNVITREEREAVDIYELLDCILHGRENKFFKAAHLKMAESLIRQKAVVV